MRSLLSRTAPVDTTFNIGLSLVLILAGAEIFAATFYYLGRARAAAVSPHSIAAVTTRPRIVSAPTAPVSNKPGPSPAPAVPSPAPSVVDQLLQEAIALRDRGDMTNALARLHEASDREPNNATVLEEIAKTYESMQLFDRSNAMWRRLQEIGPSAGAAYELADERLKLGVPTPSAGGTSVAQASLTESASPHKDIAGIAEGPTFSITEVKTTETPDPDAETNLKLLIGIKKQPNAIIDHTKVKIQVFFYDTVDDRDIKLTDADVNYEWLTPKHDWTNTNPELLSVSYLRQKLRSGPSDEALSEVAATVRPGQRGRSATRGSSARGERKYLGYRILLYYDDKLEAVQAEPSRLLQFFPPSASASPP
jgi:tetratricopeptide (TPR) repeat protein